MSALTDYYDLLLPELPGCSAPMVDLHLRETVREFCRRTSVWRQELTAIDLVAAQRTYTMGTPSDSEVVRVTSLTVNAVLLWTDTDIPDTDDPPKYERDEPPFTLSADMAQITLDTDEVPTDSVVGGLKVTAAIKPTATAATLPDFLKTQYSEAIRFGTLSRLMNMGSKKPWSDRVLAAYYETKWNAELNFSAYQGAVGNNTKLLRVKKWG